MEKNEEFKQYTPEQEAKIERLRQEAQIKPDKTNHSLSKEFVVPTEIKVNDRVTVSIDSATTIGYVLEVNNGLYTVSTPYGIMKNLTIGNLKIRFYADLSHVVIPEELKSISTKDLIAELNYRRNCRYTDDDEKSYYVDPYGNFSDDEIRAELRTRPNLRSKNTNKTIKKYINKQENS